MTGARIATCIRLPVEAAAPMLTSDLERPFVGPSLGTASLVAMTPMLGYAAGLVLLIDVLENRRSILFMLYANVVWPPHAPSTWPARARGRLNGLYTCLFFIGGSVRSALVGVAWVEAGWTLVCGVGLGFLRRSGGPITAMLALTEMDIACTVFALQARR